VGIIVTGQFVKGKWIPAPLRDIFAEFRKAEYLDAQRFYHTHLSKIPLGYIAEELARRCHNHEPYGVWESNGDEKRIIRVRIGEWEPLFR